MAGRPAVSPVWDAPGPEMGTICKAEVLHILGSFSTGKSALSTAYITSLVS